MKRKPVAIDLFAGAGGLTEGLKQAGFRVAAAIENDSGACEAYAANHPRVTLFEMDIRHVTGPMILAEAGLVAGELALLAACPPCQGFSSIRTRNRSRHMRDPRNRLMFEVLRLVRSLRPQAVMLENVPGLRKSSHFVKLVKGLQDAGYHAEWRVLNTSQYGVPQHRRRLILLAMLGGIPHFAPRAARQRSVREVIAKLSRPEASRDALHNYCVRRAEMVVARIKAVPQDGGSRSSLPKHLRLRCHDRRDGFKDVYGRMAWDAPAPTITGGCINPSKGRFLHPSQDRAITLREAALLQSFPRWYQFPLAVGRYAVAQMIGNALPPEFIRRHAIGLRESLRMR